MKGEVVITTTEFVRDAEGRVIKTVQKRESYEKNGTINGGKSTYRGSDPFRNMTESQKRCKIKYVQECQEAIIDDILDAYTDYVRSLDFD